MKGVKMTPKQMEQRIKTLEKEILHIKFRLDMGGVKDYPAPAKEVK